MMTFLFNNSEYGKIAKSCVYMLVMGHFMTPYIRQTFGIKTEILDIKTTTKFVTLQKLKIEWR